MRNLCGGVGFWGFLTKYCLEISACSVLVHRSQRWSGVITGGNCLERPLWSSFSNKALILEGGGIHKGYSAELGFLRHWVLSIRRNKFSLDFHGELSAFRNRGFLSPLNLAFQSPSLPKRPPLKKPLPRTKLWHSVPQMETRAHWW